MNNTMNGTVCQVQGTAQPAELSVSLQLQRFLAGVDSHVAELRESIATAETAAQLKHDIVNACAAKLPQAPKSLRVGELVYKSDAEMVFETTGTLQVLALLEALPGLPVVMLAGGCTSFIPEERYAADGRGVQMTPVGDIIYRLSTYCGQLQEEHTWWTRLAGRLVQIRTTTRKGSRPVAQVQSSSRAIDSHTTETTWSYRGLPTGHILRWHGGNGSNVIPLTVHQARGVAFSDAVKAVQETSARVRNDRCVC